MEQREPPKEHDEHARRAVRVVTIGGGHGQATLVGALMRLQCTITAVVSVADDGGCSGLLREDMGMAPPGDIRRCLIALATRPALAARFDERFDADIVPARAARSAGNLVLAEMWEKLGSLQRAVDWAGALLACAGRVVPVAETPGVLCAYDLEHGALEGETHIERQSAVAIAVNVEGPEHASPEAKRAVAEADLVFIGPGSFVGSTLAALTTGDLATAIVESPARVVLVKNLMREARGSVALDDHERVVRDHLVIKSGGHAAVLDVLAHADDAGGATGGGARTTVRVDGSLELFARMRRVGETTHDEQLLADAIAAHFGLRPAEARARVSLTTTLRRAETSTRCSSPRVTDCVSRPARASRRASGTRYSAGGRRDRLR